jgi:sugar lactone lactonase YvrE
VLYPIGSVNDKNATLSSNILNWQTACESQLGGEMSGIRLGINWLVISAVMLTPVRGQQYVIATYAGGAPASPVGAMALAADAARNVYFVDGYGFARTPAGSNSVFKVDSTGTITRIAGNSRTGFSGDGGPGASASLYAPLAIAADGAGNVFVVDSGNQRVRRVSPDGTITTFAGGGTAVLGDGGPATAGTLNYPTSIAADSSGNLFIGESGRVRKVTTDGIITTVAGGGTNLPGDGGPATAAQLAAVIDIAVDATGDIFILENDTSDDDDNTYRVREITPDGLIRTISPVQNCCYGGFSVDSSGNLLVGASSSIWKISPAGILTLAAGNGRYGPPTGDGGPATQAQLNGPTAIAVAPNGDLFIADNIGRTIRRVTSDGMIRAFASISAPAVPASGDGGPAIGAELQLAVQGLSMQSGLATDSLGNLYFAETGAHRVRKVSPDGTIHTVAGVGGPRCSSPSNCLPLGDNGPAINAALSYPTSVAVDAAGNVFIADSGNFRVRKVSPDGIISTVAGNGVVPVSPGGAGDGGPAVNTAVMPFIVALDRGANLFISEGFFAGIRKVSPDGSISTISTVNAGKSDIGYVEAMTVDSAGNLYVAGSDCNSGDTCYNAIERISQSGAALIMNPFGAGASGVNSSVGFISSLAVDAGGNIFVADLIGQRVVRIDANGTMSTVAGDGVSGYSGDGGAATKATLNYPFGLASDTSGNVYVADFNQAVRILRPVPQFQ